MNCAYYQQHGGSHPAHHNVTNNYYHEPFLSKLRAFVARQTKDVREK
ncbi:hypothetical protein K1T71_003822 [Dendrolimus kikuchii]|uniref:Uncharacterized protein n=1 Tax=Dendrolimus kikuchii TaxID=765133 RepID=A0ACC1D9Z5_9NEOP|nr:hypothetical protein K1T71_003822 [Dendrolimus kikuchii]